MMGGSVYTGAQYAADAMLYAASQASSTPTQGAIHCDVCNVSCAGPQSYQQHLAGKRHKQMEEQAKQPLKPGTWYCEVCKMALNGPSMYADHVKGKRHLSKVSKLGPTYGFAFPNVPSSEPVAPTAFATTPLPPNLASTSAQTTPQRMSQSSQPQTHAELGPKRAEAPAEDPGDLQQLLLVKRPKRTTGGSGGGGAEETYCEACGTRCADALQWSLHVMGPRHSGARQREAGAEGGAGGGEAVALALQARYAEISPRPEQVVALANLVQALLQPLRAASWDLRPVGSYARGTLLREQPQVAELVLVLREPPPSRADAEACLERLRAQLQPLRVDGRTLTAELRGAEAALLVWPAGEPQGGRAVEIGLAWLAGGGREAGPAELRALCYRRLRAVAHVAWYEQQAALLPQAKPALRLFRHLRRIHGAWRDLLSAFALEVLVLTSIGPAQSLVVAVRRVLAALACGRLLPGGAGIQDPVTEEDLVETGEAAASARIRVTEHAQRLLIQLAQGDVGAMF